MAWQDPYCVDDNIDAQNTSNWSRIILIFSFSFLSCLPPPSISPLLFLPLTPLSLPPPFLWLYSSYSSFSYFSFCSLSKTFLIFHPPFPFSVFYSFLFPFFPFYTLAPRIQVKPTSSLRRQWDHRLGSLQRETRRRIVVGHHKVITFCK